MDFKGRNKVSPEFSMSSMTDIVFLLLIFFMLTSNNVVQDAFDLKLPKASGKAEHKQNISVSITKDNRYYIDKEKVSLRSLAPRLRKELANVRKPTIIIRAEEGVNIEKVTRIMEIAYKNKWGAILAVQPK